MTTFTSAPPTPNAANAAQQATTETATPGLTAAVRSEVLKLTTVRAYRFIAVLTFVVGGFAAFAVAWFVTDEEITVANVFGFSAVFTAVFAAVSGILIHTAESEYGTIKQTFAAQPRRALVIVAKAISVAVFSALLGLLGLGAGALGATIGGAEAGEIATMPATTGWALGFAGLSGLLGLGLGLVARHSAAAISGLLVWWLVVESLVSVFADARYARFLPFVAGNGMLGIVDEGEPVAFAEPKSALIFAGYTIAALAIGMLVVQRSDP